MHNIKFAFVLLFMFVNTLAHAEYFVIKDYKVEMKVFGSQGMFEVNETITVEFSEPRRGIFRNIPYRYRIDGKEVEISIYDVNVEDRKSVV